jgi:hypothetical protein
MVRTPDSAEDIQKHLFRRGWTWLQRQSRTAQLALALGFLIVLFTLARLQLLSERVQRISRILVPIEIPVLDPPQPFVPISLDYTVEDRVTGVREGRLGDTVVSGDRVDLELQVGGTAWVVLFGIDSKGTHPVFGDGFRPRLVERDSTYRQRITLDSTVGREVYYAIAAPRKFDFSDDILPHIRRIFPEGRVKGPAFSTYELRLPKGFNQDLIYFEHQ